MNPKLQKLQHEAEVKQARQLVGGTIETILETLPDADTGPSFGLLVVNKGRRFHVWVDCDPEGNGPGHLNIEPQ